ncbi:MAG TPA: DNA-processing protein DprA [Vicinamibacterales bacterium]|jgi:DNA processing protein|nr:DNA-processing protein DprA [Vicinamibacterales bacterium]HJN43553.1 DNA-processing protein DprA [Vicinamibacterales bacterium]
MTLIDWVALGMLWWKGGGRAAIVRWLVDPGGARQMAVLSGANLETVTRAIDPSLARPGRLARARMAAESALETARAAGITVVPWSDIRYPTALAAIADPPPVLWIRGAPDALRTSSVAVVGSRAGSAYARAVGGELGSGLAQRGVTVVSGLARGVDAAAHHGALAADGCTIGVLGSGVDIVYPPEHTRLARDLMRRGALVSELPPGTTPRPAHFPQRNRLISGLSQAVVVVEASERSGSLITARLALEQGRDVMAVPGNVLNGRNRGAHALIKDGAKVVEDVDDILEEIQPAERVAGNSPGCGSLPEDPVLRQLSRGESYDLDDLIALSGLDGPRLLPRLLDLELSGRVVRQEGGRFVRP